MANPDGDMMAAWQRMLGQWERQFNEFSTTISGNETFAAPMNQMTQASIAARTAIEGAMERMLEAMRVASQTQLTEVIERLDRIEERLERLTAPPVPPAAAAPPPREPRRTRRPPAA